MLSKILWASIAYAAIAMSYSLCDVNYIGNFGDQMLSSTLGWPYSIA